MKVTSPSLGRQRRGVIGRHPLAFLFAHASAFLPGDRGGMDERSWLTSKRPRHMLAFLGAGADPRKCRLFVCSCARRLPRLRSAEEDRERENAVAVAERFADGLASAARLRQVLPCSSGKGFWTVAHPDALEAVGLSVRETQIKAALKADLLRDLFGNPFRPAIIEQAWCTSDVLALARAAYQERLLPGGDLDGARLAVLADALEEAGCDNGAILHHLRQGGVHVRGCWAVDLFVRRRPVRRRPPAP
jgi:hypothetical protein